jgi:hypothetical protein
MLHEVVHPQQRFAGRAIVAGNAHKTQATS